MKINKTLITAALTFCLASGASIAQEQNSLQAKNFHQVISLGMIIHPSYSGGPDSNETGEPNDSPCPGYPYC